MFQRKNLSSRNHWARGLLLEPLEDRRLLAALTVNSRLDNLNAGDGMVTLREAIFAANNDTTTDLGETGSGADTILFDPVVFGPPLSVSVTQGELAITETLTIDATDRPELTVKAFQQNRIFYLSPTAGDVTLAGLTLEDGRTTGDGNVNGGGAIRSLTTGTLTIDQSVIRDQRTTGMSASGGAIYSQGPLVITDTTIEGSYTSGPSSFGGAIFAMGTVSLLNSTIEGNYTTGYDARGGGIHSTGNVTITSSTVSGNSTTETFARGGGIYSQGELTLNNSTVSGNSTAGLGADGGGISSVGTLTLNVSTVSGNLTTADSADGGGIFSLLGNVILDNSTVSGNSTAGNSADGGGVYSKGAVTLMHTTIADNDANHPNAFGGGIWNDNDAVNLTNSIVAGNTDGGGSTDIRPGTGTLAVNFSLIEDANGLSITGGNNLFGPAALGPLTDNGGPTLTHALLASSPAIDAGDPSILPTASAFDQRQSPFLRVFDGDGVGGPRIDMGSFEFQTFSFTVDTTVDESDGDYSAGDLSLREVVTLANGTAGVDTITFDASLFATAQTITLSLGAIEITDAVTIVGPGQQNLTIDAQQQSRIFDIMSPDLTTLSGMTLINGQETGTGFFDGGGAVRSVNGRLMISESTVSGNSSSSNGGGIFGYRNITLNDTTVSGNSALEYGGGVFSADGRVTLNGSTVSGNVAAEGDGGGIYSYYNAVVNQSLVTGNTAAFYGGGVISYYGDVVLTDSTVSGNVSTDGVGGGVFAYYDVTLTNSTVSGNSASIRGGGIFANYCIESIDSTVSGNIAGKGGGLYSRYSHVDVSGSTVSGNRATGAEGGGGVFASGAVTVMNSTVTANLADNPTGLGGGILVTDGLASITNSIVADNSAGGGLNDIAPGLMIPDINFSLIGDVTGLTFDGSDNITDVVPQLAALANNGGPTQTHRMLPSSPAIDSGDPAALAGQNGIPEFDQRGVGFDRVVGGRIDMGSVEFSSECNVAGDFDCSGQVSAGDLNLVLNNWGIDTAVTGVPEGWVHDLPTGVVSAEELNRVLSNWGNTAAAPVAQPTYVNRSIARDSDRDEGERFDERHVDALFAVLS